MPLKKQTFNADEIEIYDEHVLYKRGEYWQMRMWLSKEEKYARFSLRTRNRDIAIDKAKNNVTSLCRSSNMARLHSATLICVQLCLKRLLS